MMKLYFRGTESRPVFLFVYPPHEKFRFEKDGFYDVPEEVYLHLIDEAPDLFSAKAKSSPAKEKGKTQKEIHAKNEERAKNIAAKVEADLLKEKQKQADEDARLKKAATDKV